MTKAAQDIIQFPEKSRFKPETAQAPLALYKQDGAAPAWLEKLRAAALAELTQKGLPTPLLERWKYTNIQPAIKNLAASRGETPLVYKGPEKYVQKLGTILGNAPQWLVELLSDREGGAFRYGDMMLWDLGDLFLRDGLVVDIPAGELVDKPVDISVFPNNSNFFSPRTIIRLGRGAQLTLVENIGGQGACWNNTVTQIIVGENARLYHYRVQDSAAGAVYTGNTQVQIGRDGTYEAFTLTAGAALSRNQFHAALQGANASCNLYGVNLLKGGQHGDTTAEIEHLAPYCRSNQFVRSVLAGQAHGVFQGKVHVHRPAQKTDAYQLSNALLLSEGAEMDTKPELEIYADDVKCSHGATTGKLDEEPLFYLRTRGLPEAEARALLIGAFVGEVVDKLVDNSVKDGVEQRVARWLEEA